MKAMKAFKVRGLKVSLEELDFDLIKEEMEYNKKRGKDKIASGYKKVVDILDKEKEVNPAIIEKTVNSVIDNNIIEKNKLKEEIKKLKIEYSQKIKDLNTQNQALSSISRREIRKAANRLNLLN